MLSFSLAFFLQEIGKHYIFAENYYFLPLKAILKCPLTEAELSNAIWSLIFKDSV